MCSGNNVINLIRSERIRNQLRSEYRTFLGAAFGRLKEVAKLIGKVCSESPELEAG